MTKIELKDLVKLYIDRTDLADALLNGMIVLVEARLNRTIDSVNNSASISYDLDTDGLAGVFPIPDNMNYMSNIYIVANDTEEKLTIQQIAPEQVNAYIDKEEAYFTLSNNTIRLNREITAGTMTIEYNTFITPLVNDDDTNWVATQAPDVYINGLMVELNAYLMDAALAQLWESRFKTNLDTILGNTNKLEQHGPALQMRTE